MLKVHIDYIPHFVCFSSYNLRINGLLAIDAGIFQCIGTNPAGSVQASARLIINQPSELSSQIIVCFRYYYCY